MRREERMTVQGPVKKQQPDGMSHRGVYVVKNTPQKKQFDLVKIVKNEGGTVFSAIVAGSNSKHPVSTSKHPRCHNKHLDSNMED